MKYPLYLIAIILPIFFQACTNKDSKEGKPINDSLIIVQIPEIESRIESLKFSSFFSDPVFVELETKDRNSLVGNIDNFLVVDNQFFIRSGTNFFWFDESGKLKQSVNFFGQGPGQCLAPVGLTVNTMDSTFAVFSNDKRSLLTYQFSGRLKEEIKFPVSAFNFGISNQGDILFFVGGEPFIKGSKTENYLIHSFDSSQNYLGGSIMSSSISRSLCNNIGRNDFYINDISILYYKFPLIDTIYKYSGGTFTPAIFIDFINNKIPPELLGESSKNYYDEIKRNNLAFRASNFLEATNYYYFEFRLGESINKSVSCFYNKLNSEVHLFNKVCNDFIGEKDFSFILSDEQKPAYIESDRFFFLIEPYTILQNIENQKEILGKSGYKDFLQSNPQLMSIIDDLKEYNNPIILSLKL